MGISVDDLGPKKPGNPVSETPSELPRARAQVMRALKTAEETQKSLETLKEFLNSSGISEAVKGSKYHNCPVDQNGIRFDSRAEARRYGELLALLRAGEIEQLKIKEQFTLQESYITPEGKRVRAIRYESDFSYFLVPDGGFVVEDVKGGKVRTSEYRMKAKMMAEKYGIIISEIEI